MLVPISSLRLLSSCIDESVQCTLDAVEVSLLEAVERGRKVKMEKDSVVWSGGKVMKPSDKWEPAGYGWRTY